MVMKKNTTNTAYTKSFFETVPPIKLTESRNLKLHTESWGLLCDYDLESVKINRYKNKVSSTAVLRVADVSGQVTCVVKGKTIGLLFGLTAEEWSHIEDMCESGQQLFYRNFKNGLSINFGCAQKIFYNFCVSNQKEDVLVAIVSRAKNTRSKNKGDALINIKELKKQPSFVLDIYMNYVRKAASA